MRNMTLPQQASLAMDSAIFLANQGGGSITSLFLNWGACAFLHWVNVKTGYNILWNRFPLSCEMDSCARSICNGSHLVSCCIGNEADGATTRLIYNYMVRIFENFNMQVLLTQDSIKQWWDSINKVITIKWWSFWKNLSNKWITATVSSTFYIEENHCQVSIGVGASSESKAVRLVMVDLDL